MGSQRVGYALAIEQQQFIYLFTYLFGCNKS